MKENPLLSVVTIAYNHEAYIQKCIECVLMQKVNFPIEFIIADDCSTDGTLTICKSYAARYPELIRIITSENNVGAVLNEQRAFMAARGKYIATCEGDDYWTDPDKLQKQVDFLESHPDFSVCFHRYRKFHMNDGSWENDQCAELLSDCEEGTEVSMRQFMDRWVTQYLTMVFRKDCYDFEAYRRYKYYRDTHQVYHLMKNGKCMLFSFYGGVYQITGNGIYTDKDAFRQGMLSANVSRELWKRNRDPEWKRIYVNTLQDVLYNYRDWRFSIGYLLLCSFSIFFHTGSIRRLCRNLFRIFY